ncbi:MAG: response regulator [Holophagales bacterium]|jgi:DNA-binding NtrC family response regulator|nr:response regulator [Holophagales bacterium]
MMPKPLILLVDTDAIQRETIADILKSEGFDVNAALSGDEATNTLRQKKPPFDLVITNLVMPKKDGLDVIRAALKYNPDCSVMVLSTFANASEAAEALVLGAYMVVTKPIRLDHFKNAIKRLVEHAVLLSERNYLKNRVAELESKVELLEATKGRMEMLAQQISPANGDERTRSLEELEQLANLRSKGALTEGQFQSARQQLLSRWLS